MAIIVQMYEFVIHAFICCHTSYTIQLIYTLLQQNWITVVHHICNDHVWLDYDGLTAGCCKHPIPLPEEERNKPWMVKGSQAHKALINVVWDKRFIKDLKYYTNFR